MNIIAGMMMPLTNWAPKLAGVQLLVLGGERRLDLLLAAEDLDQLVAGVGLLDLGVERAGVRPLRDEQLLRSLGDLRVTSIDSGIVTRAMSATAAAR